MDMSIKAAMLHEELKKSKDMETEVKLYETHWRGRENKEERWQTNGDTEACMTLMHPQVAMGQT